MKQGAASTGIRAHMFEHTQEPASAAPGSRAPLQLVMLSKAGPEGGGKLESHYWFFQALCTYVQPKFVYVRAPPWIALPRFGDCAPTLTLTLLCTSCWTRALCRRQTRCLVCRRRWPSTGSWAPAAA